MIIKQMIRILSSSRLHLAWEDPLVHLLLDWLQLKQDRLPSLVRRTCTNIMISFLRQISFLWFDYCHQQLSKQLSKISSGQNDGFPQYPNWKNYSNFQIQGGMIDLLQLECLTGLEEAKKLAENPIVQVWEKKDTYDLCCWDMYVRKERLVSCNLCCCDMHWKFSGRLARLVSSRTGCGVS